MAPRVLAEHDLGAGDPHVLGAHDLVGQPVGQDPVLMDARLVGEGVAPHDRLVELHGVAGQRRHEA